MGLGAPLLNSEFNDYFAAKNVNGCLSVRSYRAEDTSATNKSWHWDRRAGEGLGKRLLDVNNVP